MSVFTNSNLWETKHNSMQGGCKKRNLPKVTGQVMLLTVLVLGGSILATSLIASYLLVLEVRQSSDATNSAKAIFAADTGIEWDLYRRLKNPVYPKPVLTNGANFEVFAQPLSTESLGRSMNIFRSFHFQI